MPHLLRLSLLVALLAPAALPAQAVVGTVVDAGTEQPILGAMVRLMEGERWTGVLFLTSADGHFMLEAPAPGTYHLQVERIGFSVTRVGPVTLAAGSTLPFEVRVDTAPVRLEGLDVSAGRRRCSLRGDAAGATQALWDEVRKALDAARWTEREAGLQFQVEQRTQSLDPGGHRVLEEQRRTASLFGGNSVRTLPPEDLATGGYVREVDDFVYYYGPDADVLLSDSFLDEHCFKMVEGPEAEPHLVGLEFQPVRNRGAPDITGVLWADRHTARLERVEFSYTGLGRRPGADQARGMVRFAELSDGRWIVREWSIRAPLLGLARQFVAGVLRERVMVTAVQEQGSQVLSATGRDVTWRADLPWGGVRGTVTDSLTGGVLDGAEVALGGRSRLTRTDARGHFLLADVAPGDYWITFDHPVLDSLGVSPAWQEVTVAADSVTDVVLSVPSMTSILALQCKGQPRLVGTVTDGPGGAGVPGAVVTATPAGGGSGEDALMGVTTAEGRYWLCGPPAEETLRVVVRLGPFDSKPLEVVTPEAGFVVRDLVLPVSGSTTTMAGEMESGRAAVVGTVVDAVSREPVEGAAVRLVDAAGARVAEGLSDDRGRVLLLPGEPGSYRVQAERLGYAPTEGTVLEVGRGTRRVEVRLSTEAIPLEEMVVTVRGTVPELDRNGFYQREMIADGRFLVREDIVAAASSRTSDVLIRVPGIGPVSFNEESSQTNKRRIQFSRARASVDWRCLPVLYVDGVMVRAGGPWNPGDPPDRWPTVEEVIGPWDIEAMELYPSRLSVPARFQGPGAECGVVVVWTRRGVGG